MKELYKILLVDDEEEVRKSIIKKINWEEEGFLVVGDAENGVEALEKIDNLNPDLVFTDIRMPYMDGLALINEINIRYPLIKSIIFSGFDDFDYAKEAIKMGVIEYVLKPVSAVELTDILRKVHKSLDMELDRKRDIERLKRVYQASLPIIREQFLNGLIHGKLIKGEIEYALNEYEIDLPGADRYMVATVHIDGDKSSIPAKELIPLSVKENLKANLNDKIRTEIFSVYPESSIVIIAGLKEGISKNYLMFILYEAIRDVNRTIGVELTIGLGISVDKIENIYKSYSLAKEALGYRGIVGSGEVIYIKDMEPAKSEILRFEDTEAMEYVNILKFGNDESIIEYVEKIFSKLKESKVHSSQYQSYMINVINVVIGLVQDYGLELGVLTKTATDYIDLLDKIKDTGGFREWLLEASINIAHRIREDRAFTSKKVLEEAKAYIEENFSDMDLSLERLCKHLHVSVARFSSNFKKEVGISYVNFLTNIRLQKAVELLKTTDEKTYIIAEKVGYGDQNYFSYVFKKKYGVSPSKYRQQI
jgi:two component transcriptional regulator, araC family